MHEQRAYGKHELHIEDDILVSIPHGVITLAEIQIFVAVIEEVIAKYGHYMVLCDLRDSQGIEPAARRFVAHWSVGQPVLGVAMYNEHLIIHILFTLMIKATNIIRRQPVPYSTFKTEREARAWLVQLRSQRMKKKQAGSDASISP